MSITPRSIKQAHALVSELLAAINARDSEAIQTLCHFSSACADEVFEAVDSYFQRGVTLALGPAPDWYPMNDGALGMACELFADGKPGEARLHLDVADQDGVPTLHYQYIGS